MTRSPERSRDRSPTQVQLASRSLGPAAAECVRRCPDRVRQELAQGRDPLDAILAVVYERMRGDPALENELLGFFLREVLASGRGLARFSLIETLDVVHSFLADFLARPERPAFEGRVQFLSYLVQGMRWRAANRLRKHRSEKRLDRVQAEGRQGREPVEDPLEELVAGEEREQFVRCLESLPVRDREILGLSLSGNSLFEIGRLLGMSYDAARMALARAEDRLARLA